LTAHFGKFVAYYRVSTDKQGQSGLGLDGQRQAVMNYLNGGPWRLVAEHTEVESGKRNARPELQKALAACRRHKAKLCIAKLDRLSRNLAFIATLMDSGVEFVATDNPHANKLTIHILAAVAEHEREAISQRTKAALAAAKARGKKLGGPRLAAARRASIKARSEVADAFAANVRPIIKEIQASGVSSLRGVARALTARGVPTARGGSWSDVMVAAVLRRHHRPLRSGQVGQHRQWGREPQTVWRRTIS
jgi:DNA invertase Pin-like site-specific DNA recombinase